MPFLVGFDFIAGMGRGLSLGGAANFVQFGMVICRGIWYNIRQ